MKIYKASYFNDEVTTKVGSLIRPSKKQLALQLTKGQVLLQELQRPGKKKMTAIDFLNGVKNVDSIVLGEEKSDE